MKKFSYEWNEDIFLLHVQLDFNQKLKDNIFLYRVFNAEEQEIKKELIKVPEHVSNHRFIISRSMPNEEKVIVEYPDEVILEAFLIDDRAYYPTESFYRG